jgi:glycosyltransferase involved in cell wall biosynthesis
MSLVRVIIPTFNRAALLGTAVASALAQQDVNLEVVVIDDGSTDGTDAVLQSLKLKNPRVRWLAQPSQRVAAPRNAGLCADGRFDSSHFLTLTMNGSIPATWLKPSTSSKDTQI